ncbi:hypothetical protein [Bacillus cereus]|uniref:hypothetical protein n=1 Tax=Bacillus cereus TaxID=1396 RepID=UPI000B4AD213|nr:hypothetical protein [Bacillus cereus]
MKTEMLLSLRDIALKQNHISYMSNSHLIIQFFQQPTNNLDEAIQLHIEGNENELNIRFQFKLGRKTIDEDGEKKLTQLFKEFISAYNYNGVVRLNENADSDFYGINHSFLAFLNEQKVQLGLTDLNTLSNLLSFHHIIEKDTYYIIKDTTNTLHFLGITTFIRPLPHGKIAMIQRSEEHSTTVFDSIKDFAQFINDCYEMAGLVRNKWEEILNGLFYHQFKLENKTLVLNSGYSLSAINEQFITFTDQVLTAKNYLCNLNVKLDDKIEDFFQQNYDISPYILEYTKEFCFTPSNKDYGFSLFTFEYKFMNKPYLIQLKFDSLMSSFILQINDQSSVYNVYAKDNLDSILEAITVSVMASIDNFFNELLDGKELIDMLLKIKTFEFSNSLFRIIENDTFLFCELPILSCMPFICVKELLGTGTYTKKELVRIIKKIIELNNCVDQSLLRIVDYFNYQRSYDFNEIFLSISSYTLYIHTPLFKCRTKFRIQENGAMNLIVIKNDNEYIFPISIDNFETSTIDAIKNFENHIILTYFYALSTKFESRELKCILSRYTLKELFEVKNNTSYSDVDIQKYIEETLRHCVFPFSKVETMLDIKKWETKKITELINIFQNNKITLVYNDEYHSIFIEQK